MLSCVMLLAVHPPRSFSQTQCKAVAGRGFVWFVVMVDGDHLLWLLAAIPERIVRVDEWQSLAGTGHH